MASASRLYGQATPAADAAKAPNPAPAAQRDYRFEVASIRPTEPYGPNKPGTLHPYSPGRYTQQRVYLGGLAADAFGINIHQQHQIECPAWMSSTFFSVNATLPEGATKADLPIMLRHLLEDRFALKYHHETRQVSGYQLVVAKSGPHLTRSAAPAPDPSTQPRPKFEIKNGEPQFSKDSRSQQLYNLSTAWWLGRNKTMEGLASDLSNRLHVPVLDATGIAGEYDYLMTYTTGDEMYAPGQIPPAAGEASAPLGHPLLPDALREQLGLELKPLKNIPVDFVVIDSANKEPTVN